MKLRVRINQAEALRLGLNAERPSAMIVVKPSTLPQDERELIYRHMRGVDVDVEVVAPQYKLMIDGLKQKEQKETTNAIT